MSWTTFRWFLFFLAIFITAYVIRERYMNESIQANICKQGSHVWVGSEEEKALLLNHGLLGDSYYCTTEDMPRWGLARLKAALR